MTRLGSASLRFGGRLSLASSSVASVTGTSLSTVLVGPRTLPVGVPAASQSGTVRRGPGPGTNHSVTMAGNDSASDRIGP